MWLLFPVNLYRKDLNMSKKVDCIKLKVDKVNEYSDIGNICVDVCSVNIFYIYVKPTPSVDTVDAEPSDSQDVHSTSPATYHRFRNTSYALWM